MPPAKSPSQAAGHSRDTSPLYVTPAGCQQGQHSTGSDPGKEEFKSMHMPSSRLPSPSPHARLSHPLPLPHSKQHSFSAACAPRTSSPFAQEEEEQPLQLQAMAQSCQPCHAAQWRDAILREISVTGPKEPHAVPLTVASGLMRHRASFSLPHLCGRELPLLSLSCHPSPLCLHARAAPLALEALSPHGFCCLLGYAQRFCRALLGN